tara:strand:- start:192 stop:479 length:288 start_codon:yes stop_codon:yes gene_type:complete
MDNAKGERVMNTTSALRLSKLFVYTTSAINGLITITGKLAQKAGDAITDTRRYKVEILVEGATVKTHENCNTKQVQRLMNATSELGLTQLIVTEM